MSEIPKAYEPQAVEEKWYQFWLDQKCFVADPASPKPAYSIVIPPPNVTGMLHMGHVLNNTIQDILSRKARMDGKEVLWLPGTDHAGIATQAVVEKALRKDRVMKHRDDLGREKFLEHVWTWKEKHGGIIINQLKKLGCSCDWTRERFTMDPEYSRCVQKVFVELYKKGLIYRGKRMVNWDPAARTALSDEEVEMTETKGHLWHLKYPILNDAGCLMPDQFVIVATTRPETMLGDEAVAVNPKDERYTSLIGKKVLLPLQNKHIPIIADDFVDPKFGTGCVKVTPAHDPNDYAMATRHNLPLTVVIGPDGCMTAVAGEDFDGMDRMEAREAVVEELTEQGLLLKVDDYVHNVGFSQRSHVPIEPYLSEQWFLKYPSVEQATACVASPDDSEGRSEGRVPRAPESQGVAELRPPTNGQMRFHPERWSKTYAHWMTNLRDWCISRQLWWGHRVPVWYNAEAREKMGKKITVVELSGHELTGASIRELRAAAWEFAEQHALLNHSFPNAETGWNIVVRPASLEHAFTHQGAANIKAIVALPELIRTAVKVGSLHHLPPNEHFRAVHLFVAAARVAGELYQVKITVKEHLDGQKLYDHQLFKRNTPDGKSPTPAALASEPTRPTSGAELLVADLFADVNTDPTFTRCQIESPGASWTQDPDVLDTWFSSWLWPFATMGWPEQTPTLKKFYPTTDLVTGPDIIFFWVARMIMAGYEFMGDLPFRNVYFTGIIRDKLGRKMSKSLGNSPDPLELIAKYGADALRFGTMRSAPLGQDVLFDEKDVELGRNFCNKLWNACRFRQMLGQASSLSPTNSEKALKSETGATTVLRYEVQAEINPSLLTSDDKWILLRLDTAIREIDAAFAGYRFNEATQTLYRLFWGELCDWYLEAAKAPMQTGTPEQKANTVAVLDFVLSHMLRLFHPFLPFITEDLWHGMGYSADMPEDQGGKTIMFARWPKPLDDDFKAHYGLSEADLTFAAKKQELISQGRNLRREANIPANKRVKFVLKPLQPVTPHDAAVLKILLNAEPFDLDPNYQSPQGTPTMPTPLGDLYLPLEGLVDVGAEKTRIGKEIGKIDADIAKVEGNLNNPAFVQKVPSAVLETNRARLAELQAKKDRLLAALAALGA